MSWIDLHIHSTASDGTYTPTEIVERAKEKQLTAIALTDHDTVQGVSEAKKAAGDDLEVIAGVEISCEYKQKGIQKEIHILGLFLDTTCEELLTQLDMNRKKRDERNERMVQKFQDAGISMTMEQLNDNNPDVVVTRAHFAKYLVEHGYVKTKNDAFKKYIGKKCKFYEPRQFMDSKWAIDLIKKAGGLSFLAHAYLYKLSDKETKAMIQKLKGEGLDGIEVYHSSHNANQSSKLRAIASKEHMLISGGSDFHGDNKPDIDLSVGRGNLRLSHYILDTIKEARDDSKKGTAKNRSQKKRQPKK